MENEVVKQIKNPSLRREEYLLKVVAEKNPTKKEIVEILKADESLTAVKKINGSFGKNSFDVEVVVYDNKEAMNNIEVLGRKIRKKLEEEAKKAAEAAKAAPAQ